MASGNNNLIIKPKAISNFYIMKKQILILVFIVVASIASISNASGQAVHNSNPEATVSCTNDPLHPIAGVPYTYEVTTDPTGGNYLWWATTNTSFINAGTLNNGAAETLSSPDVTAITPANYNTSTTSSTVELTWSTDALAAVDAANPLFLAVHYTPPSAGGCADNLKVYQIEPINAFTVDITNVDDDGLGSLAYGAAEDQCFDEVQGASWDSGSGAMVYDYGTNVLIFEIVAANFTGTWTPTFTLLGLDAAQSATIEWDYDVNFSGTPVSVTSGTASATDVTTNVTDTSNGVSIYARVTVSNGTFEGIADQNITLQVTGTNSAGQSDVLASNCNAATAADNSATQTLNERPEVTNATTGGSFE